MLLAVSYPQRSATVFGCFLVVSHSRRSRSVCVVGSHLLSEVWAVFVLLAESNSQRSGTILAFSALSYSKRSGKAVVCVSGSKLLSEI